MSTFKVFGIAMIIGALFFLVSGFAMAEVTSLRGASAVDEPSSAAEIARWQEDKEPIERDYIQQPPLVPHAIESYRINLKFNKCLTCHSWANYKKAKA